MHFSLIQGIQRSTAREISRFRAYLQSSGQPRRRGRRCPSPTISASRAFIEAPHRASVDTIYFDNFILAGTLEEVVTEIPNRAAAK